MSQINTIRKKYGTVELRFKTKVIARWHSSQTLRAKEIFVLPIYMRRSKVQILNIPPEVNTTQLVAAIIMDLEEKITILQASVGVKATCIDKEKDADQQIVDGIPKRKKCTDCLSQTENIMKPPSQKKEELSCMAVKTNNNRFINHLASLSSKRVEKTLETFLHIG